LRKSYAGSVGLAAALSTAIGAFHRGNVLDAALDPKAELRQPLAATVPVPRLSRGGKAAALSITGTAIALLVSSAFDVQLGLPTAMAGVLTAAFV
jgi:hypothetical protein